MKKFFIFLVLFLLAVSCKTQKKVIETHDEDIKIEQEEHKVTTEDLIKIFTDVHTDFDSVHSSVIETIKIYDTKVEGNPLLAEISRNTSTTQVSKNETSIEEVTEESNVTTEDLETIIDATIHDEYIEETKRESKPPSAMNWILFVLTIASCVVGGLLLKKIFKL